jgi:uncharacterized protein (TIGR00251 family)
MDLFVRLTPNASSNTIIGVRKSADGQSHLAVRVTAAPENGKANLALKAVLAKAFKIPKSDIDMTRGATSRLKTIRIRADKDGRDRLTRLMETYPDER